MDRIRVFFLKLLPPGLFLACSLVLGCSFDYGSSGSEDLGLPDMEMDDVEYVRVRDGEPQVRFRAERAERYEEEQLMELRNFSFEQFTDHGEKVDSSGKASAARVELDSGNIGISGGVSLSVDSENITIETETISWQDKERQLNAGPEETVKIFRDDGTSFQGRGFRANTRSRLWEFSGPIGGVYVHEDDEEDGENADGGENAADGPGAGSWQ
ncbi:MAG: LPS export ABC transporter periplasmic protein LptC [Treponema sp.]|jgi:LPS export ABC transporter protein LptC|nr:LPS export ABC transporter periplasmic protein LptC [Treponema sp.]